MISILITDDHALIRQGLRRVLDAEKDLMVAGEASSAAETLDFLSRKKVDLVLLDINMPGRSGVEILKEIRKRHPKTRVLMLSMHAEETIAVRALKAGASGYVSKNAPPDELLRAIRKVAPGGRYVSPHLADRLAEDLAESKTRNLHESLSEREFQVLCLIGTGKTVTQIAKELSLSVPTITTYRTRILGKLKARTTAELIHYAITHKLVESLE